MSLEETYECEATSQLQSSKESLQDINQGQSQNECLTAAQRARSERNRLRARALQDARPAHRGIQ